MANKSRRNTEEDVASDDAVAATRETGGVPDPGARDQASTTGTTPNETFVGRVAGADPGVEEETGAEARSERARGRRP